MLQHNINDLINHKSCLISEISFLTERVNNLNVSDNDLFRNAKSNLLFSLIEVLKVRVLEVSEEIEKALNSN
jgi:hypothetical protein